VWISSGHCIILCMITELSLLLMGVQEIKFLYDRSYLSYVISVVFSNNVVNWTTNVYVICIQLITLT